MGVLVAPQSIRSSSTSPPGYPSTSSPSPSRSGSSSTTSQNFCNRTFLWRQRSSASFLVLVVSCFSATFFHLHRRPRTPPLVNSSASFSVATATCQQPFAVWRGQNSNRLYMGETSTPHLWRLGTLRVFGQLEPSFSEPLCRRGAQGRSREKPSQRWWPRRASTSSR